MIQTKKSIENYLIRIEPNDVLYVDDFVYLEIVNCKFQGSDLIIKSIDSESKSKNLSIKDSSLEGLRVYDIHINILNLNKLSLDYIDFYKSTFSELYIMGFTDINYTIKLDGIICHSTNILGNKFIENGSLSMFSSEVTDADFTESTYNNILFQSCIFKGYFYFFKNNVCLSSKQYRFDDCTFDKTNFNNASFSKSTIFYDCKFLKTSIFHDINGHHSTLDIESCLFEKYIQFNYSTIKKLDIDNTKFNEVASFQDTNFEIISIDRTIFDKAALFDNIKIKNISEISTRTLRAIKQQLQKADNKIDYNKFRVYEFNTYKQELREEIKKIKPKINLKNRLLAKDKYYAKIKRDLLILNLSEYVSDYGTDWKRALKWTLTLALIFYTPFFIIENWYNSFSLENFEQFPIGFFRFFIVTDFYSPLENGRTYISMNGWNHLISWIIFILAKIVIAFGIYEMIQAFRKFKA